MLKNDYLSVLMFQLKLEIKSTNNNDYLIVNETYLKQMEKCVTLIKKYNPDIVIFPEMSYQNMYDDTFKQLTSNDKLIVFGSTYIDSINYTMIFHSGKLIKVKKMYPCGSEPMIRFTKKLEIPNFFNKYISKHEFIVKGKKVYILNCLEYYETAYFISRDKILSNNLFGFLVPCSNSNPKVFIEESKALHNHNENIYSFVCNRIKDNGTCGYGNSYIFGPIQKHEKEWLTQEGIISESHNASILNFDCNTPSYSYGYFYCKNFLSRFGRSDSYVNTPQNIVFDKLF